MASMKTWVVTVLFLAAGAVNPTAEERESATHIITPNAVDSNSAVANTDIMDHMFGRRSSDPTVPPKPRKSIGDRIRTLGQKLRKPPLDTVARPFGVDSPPPAQKKGLIQRGKEAWGRFRGRSKSSPTTKKRGLLQRAKDKLSEYRDRYRNWRNRPKARPSSPTASTRPNSAPSAPYSIPHRPSPQYLPSTIDYPDGRRHHYDASGHRHETMSPRPSTPKRKPSTESLSGFAPFRSSLDDSANSDFEPETDENGDYPVRAPISPPPELSPWEKDRRATGLQHPRPQRPQGDFRPVLGWKPATGRIGNSKQPHKPGFEPGLQRQGSIHPME